MSTLRYQKKYRDTQEAIENVRLLTPSGERVSLAQLTKVSTDDGAEQINREGGQRYIAIKYSVRGRDLGSTVEEAIARVEHNVKLPTGYHLEWAGEYESQKRANKRMASSFPSPFWPSSSSSTPCSALLSGQCLSWCPSSWPPSAARSHFSSRTPISRFRLRSDFWRSSASLWKRASSCLSTSISCARAQGIGIRRRAHHQSRSRGRRSPPASRHDDDAGGHAGLAASCALPRHRLRLAASLRYRHCRRTDCQPDYRRLPDADPLCLDGSRKRHTAGGQ